MTTKVNKGLVELPREAVEAAGLDEGDEVYIDVDEAGVIHVERTQVFASGEEFFDAAQAEHQRLLDEGK